MTDEEATRALLHMTQIWWQRELPDPALQVWKREIQPRDYQAAIETINTLGREHDYWPSFAQFAKSVPLGSPPNLLHPATWNLLNTKMVQLHALWMGWL